MTGARDTLEIAEDILRRGQFESADEAFACISLLVSELRAARADNERLRVAVAHVVNDSPGTPESVRQYLSRMAGYEGASAAPGEASSPAPS